MFGGEAKPRWLSAWLRQSDRPRIEVFGRKCRSKSLLHKEIRAETVLIHFLDRPYSPAPLVLPDFSRTTVPSRKSQNSSLSGRSLWFLVMMNWTALVLPTVLSSGCSGRSIKEDNPVFTAAPPRRSLVNSEADMEEQRLVEQQQRGGKDVLQTGHSKLSSGPLTGSSIVALVNGRPVFLDDVLGGVRTIVENDPRIPGEARQQVLMSELARRIEKYTDDELVVQAVEQKIPADKRKAIEESLEPRFQEVLEGIREKEGKTTIAELDDFLSSQGTSVDQLRENFFRMQMVEGYITSVIKVPEKIDREDLLRYYEDHLDDYTPQDQIRFAKIVVRHQDHGGPAGAEEIMGQIVTQLSQGSDFGEVAKTMSDFKPETKGDMGWVNRESLNVELADVLYRTPVGEVSAVQSLDGRYEIYKVIDRNEPKSIPFADVQQEIEEKMLTELKQKAREEVREEIRRNGHVVMIVEPKKKDVSQAIMN